MLASSNQRAKAQATYKAEVIFCFQEAVAMLLLFSWIQPLSGELGEKVAAPTIFLLPLLNFAKASRAVFQKSQAGLSKVEQWQTKDVTWYSQRLG